MRNKLIVTILVISIIYSCILLQGINKNEFRTNDFTRKEINDKAYINPASASESVVQVWNVTWAGVSTTEGYRIAVDSMDNVYVVGLKDTSGTIPINMLLTKYNSNGAHQWNTTWGEISTLHMDFDIAIDSSDNIFVTGTIGGNSGADKLFVLKYNSNGELQRDSILNNAWGRGNGLAIDPSGNIFVTGMIYNENPERYHDMLIIKYDNALSYQSNFTWHGSLEDAGNKLALDPSGNIYVLGETASDIVLIKFSNSGIVKWKAIWGSHPDWDDPNGIEVDSKNNIIVTGTSMNYIRNRWELFLNKFDQWGTLLLNSTWASVCNYATWGGDIAIDSSDNIYLTGAHGIYAVTGPGVEAIIAKFNENGVYQWNTSWYEQYYNGGSGIVFDSLNNIYICGSYSGWFPGTTRLFISKYKIESDSPSDGNGGGDDGDHETEGEPISGYDLFIVFCVSSLISVISLKKLGKKSKIRRIYKR